MHPKRTPPIIEPPKYPEARPTKMKDRLLMFRFTFLAKSGKVGPSIATLSPYSSKEELYSSLKHCPRSSFWMVTKPQAGGYNLPYGSSEDSKSNRRKHIHYSSRATHSQWLFIRNPWYFLKFLLCFGDPNIIVLLSQSPNVGTTSVFQHT